MAEEQLQFQELDVVDSAPLLPGFGGDDTDVRMETGSDIIIDEERCPSRSSSPDIEVLEVLKSKTHITVDLTLDDDSQDEGDISNATHKTRSESKIAPYRRRRRQSEDAEVLDISCDDITNPLPEDGLLEPGYIDNPTSGRNQVPSIGTMGDFLIHSQTVEDLGNQKRQRLENYIKQEIMEDTLSMMMELESIIPQKCSPPLYPPTEGDNPFSKSLVQCGRIPNLGASSTEDLLCSYLDDPAYSDASGKLPESGPSHSGNFCDMPLDMSLRSVPLPKEADVLRTRPLTSACRESTSQCENPYSVLSGNSYDTGQASTSSGQFEDAISLALREAGLCSDVKTPITSHPNSAFQVVTPSTSSSDPQPAITSSADIGAWHGTHSSSSSSFGDRTLGNASLNMWNNQATPNVTSVTSNAHSQRFNTFLNLFDSSSLGVGIGLSMENSTEVTSSVVYSHHYPAGPSTSSSSSSYGQGGGNRNFVGFVDQPGPTQSMTTNISAVLPILSPNTIREHTSEMIPGLSNPLATATHDKSAESPRNPENNRSSSAAAESVLPDSPSRKEPTFSCIICLDSLKTIRDSERNMCSTVCGHVFCSACLQSALKRKKECPMCRKKLGKKQYHPLFI